MVLFPSLLLAGLIVGLGRGWLRAHAGAAYCLAALISLGVAFGVWSGAVEAAPGWAEIPLAVFTRGGLAGALFMLVMFAAAVPDGSKFMRAVMPVRGELSIVASILTLGHNIAYGRAYFPQLLRGAPMRGSVRAAAICSLAMLALMLPLFVTSFKCVRRKMAPKRWKRLQRLAYGFYALMYAHVLLLNFPGARAGGLAQRVNVALYSAIFLCYGCMRIGKALRARGIRFAAGLPGLGALAMVCVCCAAWLPVTKAASEPGALADGSYSGAGLGYNGRMTVRVTIEAGRVSDIRLTGSVDDEPYLSDATDGLIPAMLEQQTADVDVVSGATSSSHGLRDAVRDALSAARAENAD